MITTSTSFDCDSGMVTVTVNNDGPTTFNGQSATPGSWIVKLSLAPGTSQSIQAKFTNQQTVDGSVQGRYEGDPTFVNVPWHAVRGCQAPPPPTTTLDTTPKPIATTTPGQTVIYCAVPGANPPMAWPCDDLVNAPVPTTEPVTAPVAPSEPSTEAAAEPEPSNPAVGTQGRTGPPRTHTTVAQPKQLPVTGGGTDSAPLALTGLSVLLLGALLLKWAKRPRVQNQVQ